MDVAVGVVLEPAPRHPTQNLGINRRFLITRRRSETVYAGWWEFPGGKIEPGESPEGAVVRELYEEVALPARVIHLLPQTTHTYDHARVRLHPLVCEPEPNAPAPQPVEVADLRWTTLADLDRAAFLPANAPLLDTLARYLASAT